MSESRDTAAAPIAAAYAHVLRRLRAAAQGRAAVDAVTLLAVGKTRPAQDLQALAALGQRAFGENYVQEAQEKQRALADLAPDLRFEWHLIGHLQSNKCRDAALAFDWVQTVDRAKLIDALAQHRPASMPPLNVLIQVNLDDEASKSGCAPDAIDALANAIVAESRLVLRGLMAIPAPHADIALRRDAFRRMRGLFDALRARHPQADTLSMGMSEDFELAIVEGATMVRMGTALFGTRG